MGNRTIRVRGSAEISAPPDTTVISFEVESRNYDYGACMERLAEKTENLRQEMVSVGLERDQLKTIHFDVSTEYERIYEKRKFRGYKAYHRLKVEFPLDKDYLNKVLQVLSNTESHASFDIAFKIADPDPFRHQVIAKAVENSRAKARVLAEAANVKLGEIVYIDYSWSEVRFESDFSIETMSSPLEAPNFDFSPEDVDVSDSVTVVWEITN